MMTWSRLFKHLVPFFHSQRLDSWIYWIGFISHSLLLKNTLTGRNIWRVRRLSTVASRSVVVHNFPFTVFVSLSAWFTFDAFFFLDETASKCPAGSTSADKATFSMHCWVLEGWGSFTTASLGCCYHLIPVPDPFSDWSWVSSRRLSFVS